jgi:membrane protein YdbS with pleckstrin-like domain
VDVTTEPTPKTPISKASQQKQEGYPEGTLVIKRSIWAWIWWVAPWIIAGFIFIGASGDIFLMVFCWILGVISSVPRYFAWKNTRYVVLEDALVFQRGLMGTSQRYPIPASEFRKIRERKGFLGGPLGYRSVDIFLQRGQLTLSFIPRSIPLAVRLEELMRTHPPEPAEEGQADQATAKEKG